MENGFGGILLTVLFVAIAYAMLARRLSATGLTAPMVFLGLGWCLAQVQVGDSGIIEHWLHPVAEIALILLLFLDAAQIDVRAVLNRHAWPVRMLLAGLPLTVLLGTLVAWFWLPDWSLMALALLAAVLAPTDAALGQAVVTNPSVPPRLRRALTIESGLNDGLALPLILILASLTSIDMAGSWTAWLLFAGKQLVLGPLVGLAIGLLGGQAFLLVHRYDLSDDAYEGVAAVALAGATYLTADAVGGNGFIAAFVAGLGFASLVKGQCRFVYEFIDGDGQLLTWAAFFLIGFGLLPHAIAALTWPMFGLIVCSLFIVRPLAIAMSLGGSDASAQNRLFLGWFGPRGLATALFALLILPLAESQIADTILNIAINAVWISAVLHGITANPAAAYVARQARRCAAAEPKQ